MDSQSQSKLLSHSLTVVYHHLFSYPLSKQELKLWHTSCNKYVFRKKIQFSSYKNNYFLTGHRSFVVQKEKRRKISNKKMKLARRAVLVIAGVPTVEFVGITGSLAMRNSKANSDIDLMVVCKKSTLWSSRLIILVLLKLNYIKTRKAGLKTQKNLICLNMWMETENLYIEKHNLYTAHELLQIKSLVDKNNIFEKLVKINSWTANYWPNAYKSAKRKVQSAKEKQSRRAGERELLSVIKIINPLMFRLQYFYMKPKITNEQIDYQRAFFHPRDGSRWVERQLAKFGVFLKNS